MSLFPDTPAHGSHERTTERRMRRPTASPSQIPESVIMEGSDRVEFRDVGGAELPSPVPCVSGREYARVGPAAPNTAGQPSEEARGSGKARPPEGSSRRPRPGLAPFVPPDDPVFGSGHADGQALHQWHDGDDRHPPQSAVEGHRGRCSEEEL